MRTRARHAFAPGRPFFFFKPAAHIACELRFGCCFGGKFLLGSDAIDRALCHPHAANEDASLHPGARDVDVDDDDAAAAAAARAIGGGVVVHADAMRARTNASTPAVDDDARDIIVTTAATGARVDLTLSSVRSVSPEAEVGVSRRGFRWYEGIFHPVL